MQIPVVVAAAAQPALRPRAAIRTTVAGHSFQFIGADVVAPLPHIARHVVQAELIRCLRRNLVGACRPLTETNATEQPPAKTVPKQSRGELPRACPARAVPRDLVGIIAPTIDEPLSPA